MEKYIIIASIAVILIALGLVFFIRMKNFKPNPDKAKQLRDLNSDLKSAGFAYDYKNDYFYSLRNCWQRDAGYCSIYDEGSPFFNMIMDCEPITFSYNGKRWLIELWKGQYGITTGAEIGVYNTTREDIQSERFTGTFYEAISDAEQLDLSFVLLKNGKKLLKRKAHHWWLTAFKLGEFSEKDSLVMNAKIKFPTQNMAKRFVDALIATGYSRKEFSAHGATVKVKYTTPHSKQPVSQEGIQEDAVQLVNKNNCSAYRFATAKYTDTLDKLEYLKAFAPELYEVMLHSLYAKGFFKAFDWLIKLVYGGHKPKPEPPCCEPEPPCCEPEPPCCEPEPPCCWPEPPCCEPEPPCCEPEPPCCWPEPPCCEPEPPCYEPEPPCCDCCCCCDPYDECRHTRMNITDLNDECDEKDF